MENSELLRGVPLRAQTLSLQQYVMTYLRMPPSLLRDELLPPVMAHFADQVRPLFGCRLRDSGSLNPVVHIIETIKLREVFFVALGGRSAALWSTQILYM
jgi:hypothetical protein